MKDKIFGVLQRIGRSFMLPIAILPVAGLLLGIGSSFTNETMLKALVMQGILYLPTYLLFLQWAWQLVWQKKKKKLQHFQQQLLFL